MKSKIEAAKPAAHSPLPWSVEKVHLKDIHDANGIWVASCDSYPVDGNDYENAALIVRAVNASPAFDAMVEGLSRSISVIEMVENVRKLTASEKASLDSARAALAQARAVRGEK